MTGCGSARKKWEEGFLEIIVQSLNSRYMEVRFQRPSFYAGLESSLRQIVQKQFTRGNIDVLINRDPSQPLKQTIAHWDKKQALKWQAIYKKMANTLNLKDNLDLMSLSRQAGVLNVKSLSPGPSIKETKILKTLLKQALNLCEKERKREGQALKKEFQKNLKALEKCFKSIKVFSRRQKNKVKSLHDFKQNPGLDFMEGEKASAWLSRLDVDEEIARMKEHIKTFKSLILSKKAVGKQMTFYLQEMIREVNTIGSKSQSAGLTQKVVLAKTLIETLREQAQNVE